MKFKLFLVALCLCLSVLISCEDEGDVTKPTISNLEPAEGDTLTIGGHVHFEVDFSDDVALASYKVNIHSAEGHTHASASSKSDSDWELNYYSEINEGDSISGNKTFHIHHHYIEIDSIAPEGDYHFMVYCTDQAGNQSYVSRNVYLSF